MIRLDESLRRWREAGLIEPQQAAAIAAFEAGKPESEAPPPASRATAAAEAVAYAGAVVGLAGVGIFYGSQYRALGPVGRPGVLAAVTAGALVAALLLGRRTPGGAGHRARAAALTLAVAGLAVLVFQLQLEIEGLDAGQLAANDRVTLASLVGGLTGLAAALGFLTWTRLGLLAAAVAVAAYASAATLLDLRHGGVPWQSELVWMPVGAALVALGEWNRQRNARWAAEILALAGVVVPVLVAFTVAERGHLWLELLGGLIAVAALAASVARGSAGYAIAGGVGLFGFVLDIEVRYFSNSLGFSLTLITAGVALLGIAALMVVVWSRLRRT